MTCVTDESVRPITLWALEQLAPDTRADQVGVYWIDVPEEDRGDFGGSPRLGVVPLAPDESNPIASCRDGGVSQEILLHWLIGRLYDSGHVVEMIPSDQPAGVHQLADRLYTAYCIESGTAHLAGCVLEDRLIARYTRCRAQPSTSAAEVTFEQYTDRDGHVLTQEAIDSLGLAQLSPFDKGRRLSDDELVRLVDIGLRSIAAPRHLENAHEADPTPRLIEGRGPAGRQEANASPVAKCAYLQRVTAIWCKHAEGKLCFTIGDATAEVAFAGWARSLRAPPIECPQTGSATFHLAVTDDGRIAAAEEIASCDETGRRVLRREMVRCSVTEKLVLPELADACPVSGKQVLSRAMIACAMCGERVSPRTLVRDHCPACRGLAPATVADPRLARVFDEHPGLERWHGWRMSETARVYILVARGWFKRLLVVVDRQTVEPLRLAHATRLRNDWELVAPERWGDLLK